MKLMTTLAAAIVLATSASAFADQSFGGRAFQQMPAPIMEKNHQEWQASLYNHVRICGIAPVGDAMHGGILVRGEHGTNTPKAMEFRVRANTEKAYWSINHVRVTSSQHRFDFPDYMSNIGGKQDTSVWVNNREYSWADASRFHPLARGEAVKFAPQIKMDQVDFPYKETTIQGTISVKCSD